MTANGTLGTLTSSAPRIGEILIRLGHLTEEQVEEALRLQHELDQQGARRTLGEICVEQRWCEMRHIAEAMRIQQERVFNVTVLGQVLIDMGAVTLAQLQEALARHERESASLAAFLVKRGYCSEQQVRIATEIQHIRRARGIRQQTSSFFHPLNVMELLVNELLDTMIAKRKGCTCEVCRSNVFALSLNSLPAHYVSDCSRVLIVTQRARDEYGGLVRRKIADAVNQVKRRPRSQCRRQAPAQ